MTVSPKVLAAVKEALVSNKDQIAVLRKELRARKVEILFDEALVALNKAKGREIVELRTERQRALRTGIPLGLPHGIGPSNKIARTWTF